MSIEQDLDFEAGFWGNCTNTYAEEKKQFVYARYMGFKMLPNDYSYFNIGFQRILDIGGGPVSLMLKALNLAKGSVVVDPIAYPDWVMQRYAAKGIDYVKDYGENVVDMIDDGRLQKFDEVWMYNCLQHTTDPQRIILGCRKAARTLRIFEWIDIPPHEGHPQMLTEKLLDGWIGQKGSVCQLHESNCVGKAYYGHFRFKD
jgi:hypothetical protein